MTSRQLKEVEALANALALFLREFERIAPYDEFSNAKKLLREVIDPDASAVLGRLLRQRGIEL